MKYFDIVLIFNLTTSYVLASNILVVLPYPAPSHFHCFYPLLRRLTERGHNVTAISAVNPNNENITVVELTDVRKFFPASLAVLRSQNRFENMIASYEIARIFISKVIKHETYEKFINNPDNHFDLIMAELYYNDVYLALGKKYNAPVIGLVPQTLPSVYGWLTKNPIDFSYIPNIYSRYSDEMSFMQRVFNTVFGLGHLFTYEMTEYFSHQQLINDNFRSLDDEQRNLRSLIKDISLVLVNSHYSISYSRPLLPNMVEIAGIHLKPPQALPQNIQKFMDDSTNGTIYISFGTMVDPKAMENWGKVIVQVLRDLPIRVLWKWDAGLLKNIPDNFLVQNWLPQNDILQHPKCRIFVTHGGIHSLIEAVNAGVPIIGVPFFSDQPYNVAAAEKLEFGISLKDIQLDSFRKAVENILQNSQYQINAKHRSKLFNDRLADPLATATFWVEYVIRYKGAPHLQSGAAKLAWYQYLLLDVIVFFILCTVAVIFIIATACKHLSKFLANSISQRIEFLTNYLVHQKKIQ